MNNEDKRVVLIQELCDTCFAEGVARLQDEIETLIIGIANLKGRTGLRGDA